MLTSQSGKEYPCDTVQVTSDGIIYGARVSPNNVDVPTAGPNGGT